MRYQFNIEQSTIGTRMATLQSKSRWYVYELIDPRDEKTFYIGKGCGKRMHQHEADAANGVCCKKTFKINDIRNAGFEVWKRQVAFFWDEQAAYDHETDFIEAVGLSNLTNILPGGQKAWENRVHEKKARDSVISPFGYAKLITKQSKVVSWFVTWALCKENNKGMSVSAGSKLHLEIMQACFNKLFPEAWKSIKSSQGALDLVKPYFAKHGVELVYGGA